MNSYQLSRDWFNFSFENPDKIKPIHTAIYFFAVEHCNRLGWKKTFGFPTSMVLEAIGVKSYSSYKKHFDELAIFGFIKVIEYSKNQYSSNIIELTLNDKAHDKADNNALDKAFIKHNTKQSESIEQSIDSIIKQLNNKQLNNLKEVILKNTNEDKSDIKENIDYIYSLYPTKCPIKKCSTGKSQKCKDKIKELLKSKTKEELEKTINIYLLDCKKSKTWLRNFKTLLNDLPDYSEECKEPKRDTNKTKFASPII